MVNFRFHVVSIIAIFLAIAIGTVMGATFVGRGVIDRLQNRIDTVQQNADDARTRERAAQGRRPTQTAKYVDETRDYAVGRSLAGVRIDLVAERGVDGAHRRPAGRPAAPGRRHGAGRGVARGLVEARATPSSGRRCATRPASSNRAPTPLRHAAAGLLGRRLATAPPVLADDVLGKLADAKFVTLSGVSGSTTPGRGRLRPATRARTLVLGGPDSSVPADTTPALAAGLVDGEARARGR